MSARTCPSCRKQARKWRIVLLLSGDGGALKGSKVCAACAGNGVTVCAPKIAPVVQTDAGERKNQKEVLAPFIKTLESRVRVKKATSGMSNDPDEAFHNGVIETLEDVISMLKEGRA